MLFVDQAWAIVIPGAGGKRSCCKIKSAPEFRNPSITRDGRVFQDVARKDPAVQTEEVKRKSTRYLDLVLTKTGTRFVARPAVKTTSHGLDPT